MKASRGYAKEMFAVILLLLSALFACGNPADTTNTNTATLPASPVVPAQRTLSITPIAQNTPEWCWLASGQMMFQYYQVPQVNPINFQCGIIGVFEGVGTPCYFNCQFCYFGAGSGQNVALMLQTYTRIATNGLHSMSGQFIALPLTFSQLQQQIAAGKPFIAGINPGQTAALFGQSEHAVVVIGYDTSLGSSLVIVNDPLPYALAGYPDPYLLAGGRLLQPGQYLISYDALVQGLLWNTTVTATYL
jgi:hypothetical protein